MIIINLIFTLSIIFLLGDLVLALLTRGGRSFYIPERLAIDFPLGLGLIVVLMGMLGFLRISLSFAIIFGALAVIIAILLSLCFKYGFYVMRLPRFPAIAWPGGKIDPTRALEIFLVAYIGLKTFLLFFSTLIKPVVDIDAFSLYSFVAKAIFIDGKFMDPYIMGGIQDKPLFPHLSQAFFAIGMGSFNDCLLKISSPILYVCLAAVIYYALRRYSSRLFSLFFVFLYFSMPFLFYHATTAYSDVPQTAYYAAGTIYLFLLMKNFEKDPAASQDYLLISVLLLSLSVWVKRGGLFLYGIDAFVFLVFLLANMKKVNSSFIKHMIAALILSLLVLIPWAVFGRFGTAQAILGNIGAAVTGSGEGEGFLDKTGIILRTASNKLFLYSDWNLLWVTFLFTIPLGARSLLKTKNAYLLGIILLNVLALFVQFRAGGSFMWLLDGTLFDRLAMCSSPVILFFIAQVLMNFKLDTAFFRLEKRPKNS